MRQYLLIAAFCILSGMMNLTVGQVKTDSLANAALIVVDMQNDFVREGAPMEVPDARKTIEQHKQLISACRKAGIPIIFTKFIGTKEPSLLWNWSPKIAAPLFACNKGFKRYYAYVKKSLECTDVIDELAPQAGDIVIEKTGYGAFHGTALDSILRSLKVQSIILTGTVTQICVEETGREAFHYGYKTTMVTDAVSSFSPDLHAATIKNFAMKFGWARLTGEVLGVLEQR